VYYADTMAEFKPGAGATSFYLLLSVLKWAGYSIGAIVVVVGLWAEQSMSTATPASSMGIMGAIYFGGIALLFIGAGWLVGLWRDSIIK
jgi:hypothetical protein